MTHQIPDRPRCEANAEAIYAWLYTHTAEPGRLIADTLGINDRFELEEPDAPVRLRNLISRAQDATVFGLPEHRIKLWHVIGDDGNPDGHLLTVTPPAGPRLVSYHLPLDDLLEPDTHGCGAAVLALRNASLIVNELLVPAQLPVWAVSRARRAAPPWTPPPAPSGPPRRYR